MRLYEITTEYRAAIERYMDPEATQDELDETAIDLAEISVAWEEKARAVFAVMREQQAQVEALDAEIKRLEALAHQHERNAERLKSYLHGEMIRLDMPKQDLGICKMWIQNNPPRVVLETEDIDKIDAQYIRVIPEKREVDKRAILDDLKAGAELPYAHLEQSQSLRFK